MAAVKSEFAKVDLVPRLCRTMNRAKSATKKEAPAPRSAREVLTGSRTDDLLVVTLLVQIERLRLTTLWNAAQSLVPSSRN